MFRRATLIHETLGERIVNSDVADVFVDMVLPRLVASTIVAAEQFAVESVVQTAVITVVVVLVAQRVTGILFAHRISL